MANSNISNVLAALATILLLTTWQTSAMRASSGSRPQEAGTTSRAQRAPQDQQMQAVGTVLIRGPDSFVMRDRAGMEWVVELTAQTDVKSYTEGAFRGGSASGVSYMLRGRRLEVREYTISYILPGLRLEVSGAGDAQGQILADKIRIDEDDLRAAQAGQARVSNNGIEALDGFDPVQTFAVPFARGSSDLEPQAVAAIDSAGACVTRQNATGWVVWVVGFADTIGETDTNRKLSELRANAVIGYLVTRHNVPVRRMVQPFGYVESNLVADNTAVKGRAEISLLVSKRVAQ